MVRHLLGALLILALALLIGLAAMPVMAQDSVDWGGTGCAITPVAGQAHVAEVTCWNRLTSGNWITDGVVQAGEVTLSIEAIHGPGDAPDKFTFVAPGYMVMPPAFDLDENTRAVALVFPWVGM